jgi:hypothetical protein
MIILAVLPVAIPSGDVEAVNGTLSKPESLEDLDPDVFTNFEPNQGSWMVGRYHTIRQHTKIPWNLTGHFLYFIEISNKGVEGFTDDWLSLSKFENVNDLTTLKRSVLFDAGYKNSIRFRVVDHYGNERTSTPVSIWIDDMRPEISMVSHGEDESFLVLEQRVEFLLRDEHSGIDNSTIEYRLTTFGPDKWGPWTRYHIEGDFKWKIISLKAELRRGDDNYIQVKVKDNVGNLRLSFPFKIMINTYPVIVVVKPTPGDHLTEGDEIIFDAGPTYDPDGDWLTISWYISDGDSEMAMGDSYRVSNILDAGEYIITVMAKDVHNNEARYHFRITVEPSIEYPPDLKTDTDLDGIPDWWEIQWQTGYLVWNSQEDPDHDGFTNLEEYGNSTNPYSPSPPPRDIHHNEESDRDQFKGWAYAIITLSAIIISMVEVSIFLAVRRRRKWHPLREIRSK